MGRPFKFRWFPAKATSLGEVTMGKVARNEQSSNSFEQDINPSDRKLLLRASLALFLRRLNHNIPVFRDDLLRVAYYAPDEAERA